MLRNRRHLLGPRLSWPKLTRYEADQGYRILGLPDSWVTLVTDALISLYSGAARGSNP